VPIFNRNFLQFMAFPEDPGESFSPLDFDLDADPARLELMAGLYNSDVPDLTAFAAAGGKMITWHGLADAIVPHGKTEAYYRGLVETHGLEAIRETNRLFLIPGMDHCGIQAGPGIDSTGFDSLTALEAWLATGTPPESLLTTHTAGDGTTEWTRPVCAWPATARHDGRGDPNQAASFACVRP